MHQKHIHIPNIMNEEGFVSRWHEMAGFSVGAVSDLHVKCHQLEVHQTEQS